jgi:hypothetical protein
MANPVVGTAVCNCSFGAAPMPLQVVSQQTVHVCGMMAATIMDNVCTTFGMCSNPANPAVASATAAAFGVLTPMPCVPVTPAPWMPGCPDGDGLQAAAAEQHQQTDVRLRRRDFRHNDARGDR